MKLVSQLALAAALAVGVIATPVIAKDKKADAAASGPKYDLSKPFQQAALTVQTAIGAKDFAAAAAALPAAEAAATKTDDKYLLAKFKYSVASGKQDKVASAAALKEMLASGRATADEVGLINYQLGSDAYFGKDYPGAIAYLKQALAGGFKQPDAFIMAADANFKLKQYADGLTFADQGIAAQKALGKPVDQDWYARAYSGAYNSKDAAQMTRWGSELVRAYPTPQNWRSVLVTYRDSRALDPQVSLDLFRLMRQAKSIDGERDYYEYAALATDRGLPGEAKSVVTEAIASGKAPANSRALIELRDLASKKTAADLASLPAAERAAKTGRALMSTADAYLSYGEDAKAAPLYRAAIARGDVDAATANTRLGIALARSGDREGAKAAFALVQGTGPRADVAAYWRLYLDLGPGSTPAA